VKTHTPLPVDSISQPLSEHIVNNDCILIAPPGAGKSTRLPLVLLQLGGFCNSTIIMLQPRQVAARSIARYLAQQLDEPVGQTVGYQVRGDAKFNANTRLLIMTEGMLSARMQNDPELSDIALIIFDEFHERSIYSDIALGLSLEIQQGLREDLRILVMSATLQVEGVRKLLPHASLLECEGRSFPISYEYRPVQKLAGQHTRQAHLLLRQAIVAVVKEAWQKHSGHILVFLPGAADIFALQTVVQDWLTQSKHSNTFVAVLLGAISSEQQQIAIDIPKPGLRKIVLATNIAETSLTIDGVSVVIDSGREKVQKYNISRDASMLVEQAISKASSIQRAGRAGRQQAGVCYRMWDEQKQQFLVPASRPQISDMDISRELLMLLEWGSSFETLPLIDKPSDAQISAAQNLLSKLSFINHDNSLTKMGKAAAQFNTHPRLAKLLLLGTTTHKAHALLIAILVSILEGKALYKDAGSIDIELQIQFLLNNKQHSMYQDLRRWAKQLNVSLASSNASINTSISASQIDLSPLADILLAVYADNVGKHKSNGAYLMVNGNGVAFHPKESERYSHLQWLICLQQNITASQSANAELRLFYQLSEAKIAEHIAAHKQHNEKVYWDKQNAKVACAQISSLGAITLSEQNISTPNLPETQCLLVEQVEQIGFVSLNSSPAINATSLIKRIQVANILSPSINLPSITLAHIFDDWRTWLAPYLNNIYSIKEFANLDWVNIIRSRLSYAQQQLLDKDFPTHFNAPTGNKHKLDYNIDGNGEHSVVLAIRLQELYGNNSPITLGQKKWPITLSLLSPAQREIQKTQDIVGFWQGSYKEVQKDMKGRYPKHFWPDSPENAKPTTKTKKNM